MMHAKKVLERCSVLALCCFLKRGSSFAARLWPVFNMCTLINTNKAMSYNANYLSDTNVETK